MVNSPHKINCDPETNMIHDVPEDNKKSWVYDKQVVYSRNTHIRPTASPLYLLGATKVAPRDPWSPVFFTLTQLSHLSAKPNHHENIFPWVVVKQVVDSHSIHTQAYSY